jgi:ABC-2 type transport system ATP-binding protein
VHTIRLSLTGEAAAMVAPVAAEVTAAGRLIGMEIGEASLEDVFIELTGRSLR